MRLRNLGGLGITGIVAVFSGLFLLWRHRSDILNWLSAYMLRLRSELARRDAVAEGRADKTQRSDTLSGRWPHGALAIVAGVCLIFGGQLALYLDLLS